MSTRDRPLILRSLRGVNRRDGGDLVADNQFYTTQNWFPHTRGHLHRRFGSSYDLQAADVPGASKINGITRHLNPAGERFTLYHCVPNGDALAQPSTDLVLAEIDGGDLFNGGAVVETRFCYTWVGLGEESNFNTNQRAGYSVPGAPRDAWNNAAHQSITVSANTKGVRVTVPAFPSGVRSANIFMNRGNSTQMTFVGSVTTSGGSLDVKCYLGPGAARADGGATLTASGGSGGSLKAGTYYLATAWVTDAVIQEYAGIGATVSDNVLSAATVLNLDASQNRITVTCAGSPSANGATFVHVFIGRKDPKDHALIWCGIIEANGADSLTIDSLPKSSNAQSTPCNLSFQTATIAVFSPMTRAGGTQNASRHGFLIRKDADGTVSEVLPSRSAWDVYILASGVPLDMLRANTPVANDRYGYGNLWSENDKESGTQPVNHGRTAYDPEFTFFQGLTFFVNGMQPMWQTDGTTLCQTWPEWVAAAPYPTILPPISRLILLFKNSLVVSGADCLNQVYFCNALTQRNWVSGGTGTTLNYSTIGDPFGDSVTGLGIYNYTTGSSGPQGFLLAFKRNTIWSTYSLTHAAAMEQLSGRVGCTAWRTIRGSRLGTLFLGSDGAIYAIRGAGEPIPVGDAIQPVFDHLVTDESLMKKATAVVHQNFFKLAYPSASSSTYNDAQWYGDLRSSSIDWYGPHTGVNVGPQMVRDNESDDNLRFGCLATGVGSAKLDDTATYQDLGSSVDAVLEWKTSRMQGEMHFKRIMGVHLDMYYDTAYAHAIRLEGFADSKYTQQNKTLSSGSAVWDSSAFGSSSWANASYLPVPVRFGSDNLVGRTFKWKLTHIGAAQAILAAITIPFQPERRMISE